MAKTVEIEVSSKEQKAIESAFESELRSAELTYELAGESEELESGVSELKQADLAKKVAFLLSQKVEESR